MNVLERVRAALHSTYRIERELGVGSTAIVYLAHDLKHQRQVALKVLKPELAAALGSERFVAEIEVTANLRHPHILPLFDSGVADGLPFYVTPYIEGQSLRQRLEREKQLPVAEAVGLARQLASALDHAHRRGVIHRDLKPENILLQDGQPIIADFGIALALSKIGSSRLTQAGVSLGTTEYMSPEQAAADRLVDARSDIYSLGVVLYEMLSGEPPHTGPTMQAVVARIVSERPRSLRVLRDTVPPAIDQAVLRALAKLPADRFANANEFAGALASSTPGTWLQRNKRNLLRVALVSALLGVVAVIALKIRPVNESAPAAWDVVVDADAAAFRHRSAPGNRFPVRIALTPDGSQLFLAGEGRMLTKSARDVEVKPLPIQSGFNPAVSPDGKWLALARPTGFVKAAVDGTGETVLSAAPAAWSSTWLSKNKLLVADFADSAIWLVDANGSGARRLASPDSAAGHRAYRRPYALPGGRAALVEVVAANEAEPQLGVLDVSSGEVQLLGVAGMDPRYVRGGYILFTRDDKTVFAAPFSARRRRLTGQPLPLRHQVDIRYGVMQLSVAANGTIAYLPAMGGVEKLLLTVRPDGSSSVMLPERRAYAWPRVSPDGSKIALTIGEPGKRDIWVYDRSSGGLMRITSTGVNDRPEWTPDGRMIFYRTQSGGRNELWQQSADGSDAPRPLMRLPDSGVNEGIISADGRYLVVQRDFGEGGRLYYRATSGDTTLHEVPYVKPTAELIGLTEARLSPDAKWLAYTSTESGRNEVIVRPFPSLAARHQVSLNGGSEPVWARDGKKLYYHAGIDQLIIADLDASRDFRVVRRTTVPLELTMEGPHADYDVLPDGSIVAPRAVGQATRFVVIQRFDLQLQEMINPSR